MDHAPRTGTPAAPAAKPLILLAPGRTALGAALAAAVLARAPERKDDGRRLIHLDHECELKFADDGGEEAGVIEGYASKFGLLDRVGDIMEKGAFKATLADWKRRKAMPPILWQHDPYTPIGLWTELKEDDVGLYAKGQLLLDIPQGAIARSLIKAKAVRGLSIGYMTEEREIDRQTGARRLKKVALWEISPVTFPALPEAQIVGAKGDFDPAALERILRDEGRLSIRDAKAAISVFRKHALRDGGSIEQGPRDEAAMLMTLRKAAEALR
jgi:HK97 family phage prohead protease